MNTKNKVALCNNLNMNFDEASELFCEESLQSMQMAQINGGAEWWDNFCSWIKDVFKDAVYFIEAGSAGVRVGVRLMLGATNRPTDDGIQYNNGSLLLSHQGCYAQFSMTNKNEYVMVNAEYSGQEISTPTPA